jgi:hypothetical protein
LFGWNYLLTVTSGPELPLQLLGASIRAVSESVLQLADVLLVEGAEALPLVVAAVVISPLAKIVAGTVITSAETEATVLVVRMTGEDLFTIQAASESHANPTTTGIAMPKMTVKKLVRTAPTARTGKVNLNFRHEPKLTIFTDTPYGSCHGFSPKSNT